MRRYISEWKSRSSTGADAFALGRTARTPIAPEEGLGEARDEEEDHTKWKAHSKNCLLKD